MNENDRQNQISPASPSALPSSHLLTRPCAQSDHFFSYDSATTVGPIGPISATNNYFPATTVVRFPATISPTTPHDGSTKTPPWRRRASQPDTNRWLLPPPSSIPIGTRPQAGSKLQSDQNQPRKSAIAAKESQLNTKSPALPPAPRPFFDPSRTTAPPWPKATVGTNGKT